MSKLAVLLAASSVLQLVLETVEVSELVLAASSVVVWEFELVALLADEWVFEMVDVSVVVSVADFYTG